VAWPADWKSQEFAMLYENGKNVKDCNNYRTISPYLSYKQDPADHNLRKKEAKSRV